MAVGTGLARVPARQRERSGVVKHGALPCVGVVALGARGTEPGGRVIGVGCLLEVRLVAADTIGGKPRKHAALMAVGAGFARVPARQWERSGVIKYGALPGVGVVALGARGAKTACNMVGAKGLLVVRLVTADAVGR